MGIRYYAYPIEADEYSLAVANPCLYHGDDPLADAWGPPEEMPDMLYLDKCWHDLQHVLEATGPPDRPALDLVRGEVEHTPFGWKAYESVLSPEQVRAAADDLETVSVTDLRPLLRRLLRRVDSELERYIAHYLVEAQRYSRRLADEGRGLVYLIG